MNNKIKILYIGNDTSMNKLKSLSSDDFNYTFELLSDNIDIIKYRLQHNSYDILIIDYIFLRNKINILDIFSFSKMAFAMSRPSIILCNNIFQKIYLKFILFHTSWLLKFQSAKSFVNILTKSHLKENTQLINTSLSYHDYITKISKEIYTVFINQ